MPGPTRVRGLEAVTEAIKKGEVTEETITERARNVLKLIKKVGGFENPTIPPERSVVDPAHSKLIRDVAGQGITLLKNDGNILPLKKEAVKGKTIGLFGLAKEALIHGGGSASLNAHYRVTPEEGLKAIYGDSVTFKYAKGTHSYRLLPPLKDNCTDEKGNSGWTMQFFRKGKSDSSPFKTTHEHPDSSFSPILDNEAKESEIRFISTFVPSESGSHYLGCSGIGPTTVHINDKLVFEQKGNSPDPMGFLLGGNPEEEFTVPFTAGQSYKIQIHSKPPPTELDSSILAGLPGFRLGFMLASEHDVDLLSEAKELAKQVDYAIVFTGHTPAWETEGQDQLSFHLPRSGSQDALVSAIASLNPSTIVVNSTGVAVALPWLHSVPAFIQAWFPGQEAGNSIADIISGAVNPSGRLPISWPKRIEDAPAYGNFPGEKKDGQLTVKYEEGVFVGYRHYDRVSKDVCHFPFGFGLSYTSFSLYGAHVANNGEGSWKATVAVKNTGKVDGSTVVQLYVGRKSSSPDHPVKTLVAFRKAALRPGEETSVELVVRDLDFAYFCEKEGRWAVDAGEYDFSFGQSVRHIEGVVTVKVDGLGRSQGKL